MCVCLAVQCNGSVVHDLQEKLQPVSLGNSHMLRVGQQVESSHLFCLKSST